MGTKAGWQEKFHTKGFKYCNRQNGAGVSGKSRCYFALMGREVVRLGDSPPGHPNFMM